MPYAVQFTLKSRNAKVGPMPVSTTGKATCPDTCPLKANGCYAEAGPLGILWAALSRTEPGKQFATGGGTGKGNALTWDQFAHSVAALPDGTLWRHNQAGDLPGIGNVIDAKALSTLVKANDGKRGFTYTHKPLTRANLAAIRDANARGFTINLSGNTLAEADTLAETGLPTVVVLPMDAPKVVTTPKGRKVATCPATYRDDVSCASCQLCQRQDRKVIVGFPAHGASKRKANAIAMS